MKLRYYIVADDRSNTIHVVGNDDTVIPRVHETVHLKDVGKISRGIVVGVDHFISIDSSPSDATTTSPPVVHVHVPK